MVGDVRAIPALIRALYSEDKLTQFDEIHAQTSGTSDAGTLVLWGETYFDISDLRCAAAQALGRIADVQALPSLIDALKDPYDVYVQQAAVHALERIATPEALQAVINWQNQQSRQ